MALVWAAGIIWFAYDFAGSEPQGQDNLAANASGESASVDANKIADALGTGG